MSFIGAFNNIMAEYGIEPGTAQQLLYSMAGGERFVQDRIAMEEGNENDILLKTITTTLNGILDNDGEDDGENDDGDGALSPSATSSPSSGSTSDKQDFFEKLATALARNDPIKTKNFCKTMNVPTQSLARSGLAKKCGILQFKDTGMVFNPRIAKLIEEPPKGGEPATPELRGLLSQIQNPEQEVSVDDIIEVMKNVDRIYWQYKPSAKHPCPPGVVSRSVASDGGVTMRKLMEGLTPDAQCAQAVENEFLTDPRSLDAYCWLCGGDLVSSAKGRDPCKTVCEHIVPVLAASIYNMLITYTPPKVVKAAPSQQRTSAAQYEYAWSHQCCNTAKSDRLLGIWKEGRYEIDELKCDSLVNTIFKAKGKALSCAAGCGSNQKPDGPLGQRGLTSEIGKKALQEALDLATTNAYPSPPRTTEEVDDDVRIAYQFSQIIMRPCKSACESLISVLEMVDKKQLTDILTKQGKELDEENLIQLRRDLLNECIDSIKNTGEVPDIWIKMLEADTYGVGGLQDRIVAGIMYLYMIFDKFYSGGEGGENHGLNFFQTYASANLERKAAYAFALDIAIATASDEEMSADQREAYNQLAEKALNPAGLLAAHWAGRGKIERVSATEYYWKSHRTPQFIDVIYGRKLQDLKRCAPDEIPLPPDEIPLPPAPAPAQAVPTQAQAPAQAPAPTQTVPAPAQAPAPTQTVPAPAQAVPAPAQTVPAPAQTVPAQAQAQSSSSRMTRSKGQAQVFTKANTPKQLRGGAPSNSAVPDSGDFKFNKNDYGLLRLGIYNSLTNYYIYDNLFENPDRPLVNDESVNEIWGGNAGEAKDIFNETMRYIQQFPELSNPITLNKIYIFGAAQTTLLLSLERFIGFESREDTALTIGEEFENRNKLFEPAYYVYKKIKGEQTAAELFATREPASVEVASRDEDPFERAAYDAIKLNDSQGSQGSLSPTSQKKGWIGGKGSQRRRKLKKKTKRKKPVKRNKKTKKNKKKKHKKTKSNKKRR